MKSISNRCSSKKGIIFCLVWLLASTQTTFAAQFLCSFGKACEVDAQSEECIETNEIIFVRTAPDAVFPSFEPDPDSKDFIGDTNVFGTPGILFGDGVPASLRQSFPDSFRRAAVRLNTAKRARETTSDEVSRLTVIAYSHVISSTGSLAIRQILFSIDDHLDATIKVGVDPWRDVIHHGTCEDLT